jgi:hypothetical protein
MAKKKNSRKVLAVALGIMGIAGLSLASASQLNITATTPNIATGTQTFGDPCSQAVNVAYTLDAASTSLTPVYKNLVISGISANCVTTPAKKITYQLTYQTSNGTTYAAAALFGPTDVVIDGTNSGSNSLTVPLPAAALPGNTKFVSIAITIQ